MSAFYWFCAGILATFGAFNLYVFTIEDSPFLALAAALFAVTSAMTVHMGRQHHRCQCEFNATWGGIS